MRLGYGVRVKESNGREYVDVWRYEARGRRRVQVFEYAGPLRDPATEGRVAKILEKAHAQALEELRRRVRLVGATPRVP